jgi:hypothetical protein
MCYIYLSILVSSFLATSKSIQAEMVLACMREKPAPNLSQGTDRHEGDIS